MSGPKPELDKLYQQYQAGQQPHPEPGQSLDALYDQFKGGTPPLAPADTAIVPPKEESFSFVNAKAEREAQEKHYAEVARGLLKRDDIDPVHKERIRKILASYGGTFTNTVTDSDRSWISNVGRGVMDMLGETPYQVADLSAAVVQLPFRAVDAALNTDYVPMQGFRRAMHEGAAEVKAQFDPQGKAGFTGQALGTFAAGAVTFGPINTAAARLTLPALARISPALSGAVEAGLAPGASFGQRLFSQAVATGTVDAVQAGDILMNNEDYPTWEAKLKALGITAGLSAAGAGFGAVRPNRAHVDVSPELKDIGDAIELVTTPEQAVKIRQQAIEKVREQSRTVHQKAISDWNKLTPIERIAKYPELKDHAQTSFGKLPKELKNRLRTDARATLEDELGLTNVTQELEQTKTRALEILQRTRKQLQNERAERRKFQELAYTSEKVPALGNFRALQKAMSHPDGLADKEFVFMDMKALKEHNDTHGHAAGDLLLNKAGLDMASVAEQMGMETRDLFHTSGDEFVALVPKGSGKEFLQRVADIFGEHENAPGMRKSKMEGEIAKDFADADIKLKNLKANREASEQRIPKQEGEEPPPSASGAVKPPPAPKTGPGEGAPQTGSGQAPGAPEPGPKEPFIAALDARKEALDRVVNLHKRYIAIRDEPKLAKPGEREQLEQEMDKLVKENNFTDKELNEATGRPAPRPKVATDIPHVIGEKLDKDIIVEDNHGKPHILFKKGEELTESKVERLIDNGITEFTTDKGKVHLVDFAEPNALLNEYIIRAHGLDDLEPDMMDAWFADHPDIAAKYSHINQAVTDMYEYLIQQGRSQKQALDAVDSRLKHEFEPAIPTELNDAVTQHVDFLKYVRQAYGRDVFKELAYEGNVERLSPDDQARYASILSNLEERTKPGADLTQDDAQLAIEKLITRTNRVAKMEARLADAEPGSVAEYNAQVDLLTNGVLPPGIDKDQLLTRIVNNELANMSQATKDKDILSLFNGKAPDGFVEKLAAQTLLDNGANYRPNKPKAVVPVTSAKQTGEGDLSVDTDAVILFHQLRDYSKTGAPKMLEAARTNYERFRANGVTDEQIIDKFLEHAKANSWSDEQIKEWLDAVHQLVGTKSTQEPGGTEIPSQTPKELPPETPPAGKSAEGAPSGTELAPNAAANLREKLKLKTADEVAAMTNEELAKYVKHAKGIERRIEKEILGKETYETYTKAQQVTENQNLFFKPEEEAEAMRVIDEIENSLSPAQRALFFGDRDNPVYLTADEAENVLSQRPADYIPVGRQLNPAEFAERWNNLPIEERRKLLENSANAGKTFSRLSKADKEKVVFQLKGKPKTVREMIAELDKLEDKLDKRLDKGEITEDQWGAESARIGDARAKLNKQLSDSDAEHVVGELQAEDPRLADASRYPLLGYSDEELRGAKERLNKIADAVTRNDRVQEVNQALRFKRPVDQFEDAQLLAHKREVQGMLKEASTIERDMIVDRFAEVNTEIARREGNNPIRNLNDRGGSIRLVDDPWNDDLSVLSADERLIRDELVIGHKLEPTWQQSLKQLKDSPGASFQELLYNLRRSLVRSIKPLENVDFRTGQWAQLFSGWSTRAEQFLFKGPFRWAQSETGAMEVEFLNVKPLAEIVGPLGRMTNKLRTYLVARKELESPGKSGIDHDVAMRVVENAPAEVRKAAEEFTQFSNASLLYAADAGLVKGKTAKLLIDLYKSYAPLSRVFDGEEIVVGAKREVGVRPRVSTVTGPRKILYKLTGGKAKILDPIQAAVENLRRNIREADLNRIVTQLYDAVNADPESFHGIAEVDTKSQIVFGAEAKRVYAEMRKMISAYGIEADDESIKQLVAIGTRNRLGKGNDRVVGFKDGKRFILRVSPDLADAVQSLSPDRMAWWIRLLGVPTRLLKAGVVLQPLFPPLAYMKDAVEGQIRSKYGMSPLGPVRGLGIALSGTKIAKLLGFTESEWSKQYRAGGGAYSALSASEARTTTSAMRYVLRQGRSSPLMHPIELLRAYARPFEEAVRMEEFRLARKAGEDVITASVAGRNVTIDFNQAGGSMQALNHIIPFLNPAIQSLATDGKILREQPGRVAAIGSAMMLGSWMLMAANDDDQELTDLRRTPYGELFLWFRLPDGTIAKAPKPYFWGQVFMTSAEFAWDRLKHDDPDAAARWRQAVATGAWGIGLPAIAQLYMGLKTNKVPLTGAPIVPADLEEVEPIFQVTPNTSIVGRGLGKVLNVSPLKVDFVVGQAFGSLGRDALNAVSIVDRANRRMPTPVEADLPVVGRLFGRYPSGNVEPIYSFYQNAGKVEQVANTVNYLGKTKPDQLATYVPAHTADIAVSEIYAGARATLADMRQSIKRLQDQEGIPPEEKRQLIDGILKAMIEVARQSNEIGRQVHAAVENGQSGVK